MSFPSAAPAIAETRQAPVQLIRQEGLIGCVDKDMIDGVRIAGGLAGLTLAVLIYDQMQRPDEPVDNSISFAQRAMEINDALGGRGVFHEDCAFVRELVADGGRIPALAIDDDPTTEGEVLHHSWFGVPVDLHGSAPQGLTRAHRSLRALVASGVIPDQQTLHEELTGEHVQGRPQRLPTQRPGRQAHKFAHTHDPNRTINTYDNPAYEATPWAYGEIGERLGIDNPVDWMFATAIVNGITGVVLSEHADIAPRKVVPIDHLNSLGSVASSNNVGALPNVIMV